MIDIEVARDKLAQFETPDDIANFLISEEVKGSPSLSESCAIAEWMKKTTGRVIGVSRTVLWDTEANVEALFMELIEHTPAMTEFTVRFDRREYPELLRDGYWVPGVSTWK